MKTSCLRVCSVLPASCRRARNRRPSPIDNDDIGGVVTGSERSGGRRMGDRRDHRSADPLHQERRHRRPGALRHPRPADRQLSGLGARLRSGRFAPAARQARPDPQSHRREGARRPLGRALLSGDLLVHDDEDAAREEFGGSGENPEEHHARHLAPAHEQRRLRRLPSARPGIDAHDPGAVRSLQVAARRPGSAASPPASPAR